MKTLKGSQKKYLRGRAHGFKPVVLVGQGGLTEAVIRSIDQALHDHELIKIKFIDFKEKEQKNDIAEKITGSSQCEMVGMIGHTAIFFREHPDPEKRKIKLP